jgi:hypothetical protein
MGFFLVLFYIKWFNFEARGPVGSQISSCHSPMSPLQVPSGLFSDQRLDNGATNF